MRVHPFVMGCGILENVWKEKEENPSPKSFVHAHVHWCHDAVIPPFLLVLTRCESHKTDAGASLRRRLVHKGRGESLFMKSSILKMCGACRLYIIIIIITWHVQATWHVITWHVQATWHVITWHEEMFRHPNQYLAACMYFLWCTHVLSLCLRAWMDAYIRMKRCAQIRVCGQHAQSITCTQHLYSSSAKAERPSYECVLVSCVCMTWYLCRPRNSASLLTCKRIISLQRWCSLVFATCIHGYMHTPFHVCVCSTYLLWFGCQSAPPHQMFVCVSVCVYPRQWQCSTTPFCACACVRAYAQIPFASWCVCVCVFVRVWRSFHVPQCEAATADWVEILLRHAISTEANLSAKTKNKKVSFADPAGRVRCLVQCVYHAPTYHVCFVCVRIFTRASICLIFFHHAHVYRLSRCILAFRCDELPCLKTFASVCMETLAHEEQNTWRAKYVRLGETPLNRHCTDTCALSYIHTYITHNAWMAYNLDGVLTPGDQTRHPSGLWCSWQSVGSRRVCARGPAHQRTDSNIRYTIPRLIPQMSNVATLSQHKVHTINIFFHPARVVAFPLYLCIYLSPLSPRPSSFLSVSPFPPPLLIPLCLPFPPAPPHSSLHVMQGLNAVFCRTMSDNVLCIMYLPVYCMSQGAVSCSSGVNCSPLTSAHNHESLIFL